MSDTAIQTQVISILAETLLLDVTEFDQETELLGTIPEIESIGVVMVLTAFEEHFGISVADDELDAEVFATVGTLTAFVESHSA